MSLLLWFPPPFDVFALVANYGSANVTPLTLSEGTWSAGTPVAVGTGPVGVAISPDGTRALVANYGSANVTPLTLSEGTWTAGTPVAVGTNPFSLGPSMIYESR
jgi:DNA-binding beta-propeller fold protein YncE